MTTQECQALVQSAIRRGLAKLKEPVIAPAKTSKYHNDLQRRRRQENIANGLTTDGKPRQRNYQHLTGWTASQKLERERSQKLAWRIRQYYSL
jgi:hypothetical protein